MHIYKDLTQLVGSTPLVELSNLAKIQRARGRIVGKLEYFNPLGSVKDRVALAMVEEAEKNSLLLPGGTVIEPTSGNTGIGLAFICAIRGYHLILTMPETMSVERRNLLAALGAEIVLTPGSAGMTGSIARAQELLLENPGAFMPMQFENPANPEAHLQTTAREIWRDTNGKVDILVSAFGTGGTITGCGKALKSLKPSVRIVGVEPAESPVVSEGRAGAHGIQGIGAGFVPAIFDRSIVDDIIPIPTPTAREMARTVAKTDGLLVGISSGAALAAALELAKRPENAGKLIVVILPDTGERYLSTGLYDAPSADE